jgi:hypothetical protein
MIFKKLRYLVTELRINNEILKSQNEELEWAHIYHDTIKDRGWLKNLAISPGRWAGNYSFFYVLVRILSEYKPNNIIEFGLGESSKIISSFLANELQNSKHLIVEQDKNWIKEFKSRFKLSENSAIIHLPLATKTINTFTVNIYADIIEKVKDIFDLYVIDGPFGSENFSRYDICLLAEKLNVNDDFIIIIDDYQRRGEKETAANLVNQLTQKGIKIYTGIYKGNKSQIVLATEKYRFVASM